MLIDAGNATVISFLVWVPLCATLQGRENNILNWCFICDFTRITEYKSLMIMRTKDWITWVFIEIIWVLIRNYSHHFVWCNCPQQGSLLRLKSSSKQITRVGKTCKTQNKTHKLHYIWKWVSFLYKAVADINR